MILVIGPQAAFFSPNRFVPAVLFEALFVLDCVDLADFVLAVFVLAVFVLAGKTIGGQHQSHWERTGAIWGQHQIHRLWWPS